MNYDNLYKPPYDFHVGGFLGGKVTRDENGEVIDREYYECYSSEPSQSAKLKITRLDGEFTAILSFNGNNFWQSYGDDAGNLVKYNIGEIKYLIKTFTEVLNKIEGKEE